MPDPEHGPTPPNELTSREPAPVATPYFFIVKENGADVSKAPEELTPVQLKAIIAELEAKLGPVREELSDAVDHTNSDDVREHELRHEVEELEGPLEVLQAELAARPDEEPPLAPWTAADFKARLVELGAQIRQHTEAAARLEGEAADLERQRATQVRWQRTALIEAVPAAHYAESMAIRRELGASTEN